MLRGTVTEAGDPQVVSTRYGEREVADVDLSTPDGAATVSLWGDWAETAGELDAGMALGVTDPADEGGEYATTGDSYVVVEPDRLVNVTDVRGWVQCPRIHYLNRLRATPLAYPVVKGTIVHEVFGDLLRGRDLAAAIEERVADAGLELGLLDRDAGTVEGEVRQHARAIEGWLAQETLVGDDAWRSERTLTSERLGLKGRCDAVRRDMPVELKTGKNTDREPRFEDKVQAACYALLLRERGLDVDTGTLLYTKNATLGPDDGGDQSPAKEFSIGDGLLDYVVRARNELAAMAARGEVPTGYEADAVCEYCFEQDACRAVAGRLDQESKAGRIGSAVPEHERAYFERFEGLIEEEREAVHRAYADLWRQSAAERAEADRALIGLEPTDRRRLEDGRWELRAEGTGATSKLREGDHALASDGDPVHGDVERARIERLDEEVVVTVDEPVELRRLDVSPSEFGVDRMLTALSAFVLRGDERQKEVLIGNEAPAFADENGEYVPSNEAQDRAVNRAVNAEQFALIHGPPGTGKTHTIARLVEALLARDERVLLSAYTNRAVDNALETLRDRGIEDALRVGTESGVRADMADLRLPDSGAPEALAGRLREAPVVAATTTTCGSRPLRSQAFDVAVVDEASQLTEPDALAAVERADRFVLVGDHRQLPPVVRAENELSRSLFERLIEAHPEAAVTLDRQYRMAQAIQAFPSEEFYDGALRPASGEVAARRVDDVADAGALPAELRSPVSFVDVKGDGADHTDAPEAERVAGIVGSFAEAGLALEDVGVIAPFRAQVAEIESRVPDAVTVDTVDRFQGSSEEVIVVSFVATGSLDGPLFEDGRRLNVALTRARRALVLVGDREALGSRPRYARMLEWAEGVR